MSNYQHLITKAFNQPLAVQPAYARVFFSALGNRMGVINKLVDVDGNELDADQMQLEASSYRKSRAAATRSFRVMDGIAIIPVSGSLVHKLGALHPYSGMTGYDGLLTKLSEAMDDPEVRGVMLDVDSPGGMVSGCFDLADIIARYRQIKPIWSLGYDMHCSAAQMIASSCSRRLITQTGTAGSVGVIMAHANIEKMLEKQGTEVTLIFSGKHKADGNPYAALPKDVREKLQGQLDATRQMFASKVAEYMGKDVNDILATEAETFEGKAAVEIGFADEVVNGADAVAVMIEHLDAQGTTTVDMGASMTTNVNNNAAQPTQPAAALPGAAVQDTTTEQPDLSAALTGERQRVLGILGLEEAKGREALANQLAAMPSMSVDAAKTLLASVPAAVAEEETTALDALATQHGESLTTDVSDDTEMSDDDKAVGSLLSAFLPQK
ncbi:S49 family peptidase [Photobacterium sp. 1_MG-2023]|uniref:S49 family peptidase n=1 Tax=Photobacterium sp. 1_MG-2023 TaxID=3062646 RepID=UPI0026E2D4BA|nr:S49 family peptidase [Photobacterium sp. 1_MG-2023]MDO6707929.1 S49 family peptidase [Photobacterium sp. 1_MG-2023]